MWAERGDLAFTLGDVPAALTAFARAEELDPDVPLPWYLTRARATFRGWLYTITRNMIGNFLRRQRNRPKGTGDADARERLGATPTPPEDGPDGEWEREYQRRLAARAMELVKPEFQANTWKSFWEAAVGGRPAQAVGAELRMTPGAVYVAKCRVLVRLRDEVRRLQAEAEEW